MTGGKGRDAVIVTDQATWARWNETGKWVLFRSGECDELCAHSHADWLPCPILPAPPDSTRYAVVVPCDECGGDRAEAVQWRDWQTVEMIDDCDTCDPDGLVTVGHVVVEWGPWLVVESWVGARANPHKVACLSHNGFLDWRWSSDDLTLVGRYAIGGKVVVP